MPHRPNNIDIVMMTEGRLTRREEGRRGRRIGQAVKNSYKEKRKDIDGSSPASRIGGSHGFLVLKDLVPFSYGVVCGLLSPTEEPEIVDMARRGEEAALRRPVRPLSSASGR